MNEENSVLPGYAEALARLRTLIDDTLARGRSATQRHESLVVRRARLADAGLAFGPEALPPEHQAVHRQLVRLIEDLHRQLPAPATPLVAPTEDVTTPERDNADRGSSRLFNPETAARTLRSRHRI